MLVQVQFQLYLHVLQSASTVLALLSMLNPLLSMFNVYKQQLGLHKIHDQLHIGMSLPILSMF